MPYCDVCHQDKIDAVWCPICQARICSDCKHNWIARAKAALAQLRITGR